MLQSKYGGLFDAEHVLPCYSPSTVDCLTLNTCYHLPKRRNYLPFDTTLKSFTTRKLQLHPYKKIKYYIGTYWQGMMYEGGGTTRRTSETLTINHQTTWRHITRRQYSHYRENLKSPSANSPSFPGYIFFVSVCGRCLNGKSTAHCTVLCHCGCCRPTDEIVTAGRQM